MSQFPLNNYGTFWLHVTFSSDVVLHCEVPCHLKPLSPAGWQFLSPKQSEQWKFCHGKVISFQGRR